MRDLCLCNTDMQKHQHQRLKGKWRGWRLSGFVWNWLVESHPLMRPTLREMQQREARQESKQPQPSYHQAKGGDFKDVGNWKDPCLGWQKNPLPASLAIPGALYGIDMRLCSSRIREMIVDEDLPAGCPEQVSHWAHPNYRYLERKCNCNRWLLSKGNWGHCTLAGPIPQGRLLPS